MLARASLSRYDDRQRVRYLSAAIAGVANVMARDVPVQGYMRRSLLGNFEWISGYVPKFGLVAVDRTTFARTLTQIYATVVRDRG